MASTQPRTGAVYYYLQGANSHTNVPAWLLVNSRDKQGSAADNPKPLWLHTAKPVWVQVALQGSCLSCPDLAIQVSQWLYHQDTRPPP